MGWEWAAISFSKAAEATRTQRCKGAEQAESGERCFRGVFAVVLFVIRCGVRSFPIAGAKRTLVGGIVRVVFLHRGSALVFDFGK